jgi:hypothetical protein
MIQNSDLNDSSGRCENDVDRDGDIDDANNPSTRADLGSDIAQPMIAMGQTRAKMEAIVT